MKLAQCYQQTYEKPKKTTIFSSYDSNLTQSSGYHSNSTPEHLDTIRRKTHEENYLPEQSNQTYSCGEMQTKDVIRGSFDKTETDSIRPTELSDIRPTLAKCSKEGSRPIALSMDTTAGTEHDAVVPDNVVNNDCRTCAETCLSNKSATTSCLQTPESAYNAMTKPGSINRSPKSGSELICSCVASAASCIHTEEKLRALTCLVRAK